MRRKLLICVTYLSLLASIGSFVISALPLLPDGWLREGEHRQVQNQSQRGGGEAPLPSAEADAPARIRAQSVATLRWRETIVGICVGMIVVCAAGIIVIRIVRFQQKVW